MCIFENYNQFLKDIWALSLINNFQNSLEIVFSSFVLVLAYLMEAVYFHVIHALYFYFCSRICFVRLEFMIPGRAVEKREPVSSQYHCSSLDDLLQSKRYFHNITHAKGERQGR